MSFDDFWSSKQPYSSFENNSRLMDGRTDRLTDMTSYRDAQLHLKIQDSQAHYGPKQPRIQTEVLGHSLVRSLVRSHRSLVRLLRTASFARALHCAHSFARSLTLLTPSLVGQWYIRWLFCLFFFPFWTVVKHRKKNRKKVIESCIFPYSSGVSERANKGVSGAEHGSRACERSVQAERVSGACERSVFQHFCYSVCFFEAQFQKSTLKKL